MSLNPSLYWLQQPTVLLGKLYTVTKQGNCVPLAHPFCLAQNLKAESGHSPL